MNQANFLILAFALIFIAIWNGVVLRWGQANNATERKNMNDYWHMVGWLIRAALTILAIVEWGLLYGWIAFILSWHMYDGIINLIRRNPFFAVDDKTKASGMATVIWIIKGVTLSLGLLFLIF